MIVDAILPAGGRIEGDFAREAGAEVKALVRVNGTTLLERTLAAASAGSVRRAVLIGPAEIAEHPAARGVAAVLPEAATGPDNIMRGLEWLLSNADGAPPDRVLVLTTDLPFVSAEDVGCFLEACPHDAAIAVPAVRREDFESRFPGSVNQFVSLRDGQWTIGGAFLLDPVALRASKEHIDRVFRARKSQVSMALLLGLPMILRYVTRRLAIPHIEARCSTLLGCSGAAVFDCPPELAFDIDLLVDYRYAVDRLREEAPR